MPAGESAGSLLSLFLGAFLASCSVDLDDLTSGVRDASIHDTGRGGQAGSTGSGGTATGGAAGAGTGGSAGTGGGAGAAFDASGAAGSGGMAESGAGTGGASGVGNRPDATTDTALIDASEDAGGDGGAGGNAGSGGQAGAAGSGGTDGGNDDVVVVVDSGSSDAGIEVDSSDGGALCHDGTCKRVFVSADPPPGKGNFGGLAAADTFCQSAADTNLLGGSWKAWLSDSTTSASARLTHASVPYVLLDGAQIAANWNALTSGTLAHSINVSEDGAVHSNLEVWTGTTAAGAYSGHACSGWTSVSSSITGDVGRTNETNGDWSDIFQQECSRAKVHLYCVEQ